MKKITILLALMTMVFGPTVSAQEYTFVTLDVPGASNTVVFGINDIGVVVGGINFGNSGFVYDGSTFTVLDVPGALETLAYDINDLGVIIGFYVDDSGESIEHGFIYDGKTYTTFDRPGSERTFAYGINDSGDIVGDASNISGYVYDGSTYTTLDVPGAPNGINDSGKIVGYFFKSIFTHGFVYDGTTNTTLDVDLPRSERTFAYDINDSCDIVGMYVDSSNARHGFIAYVGEIPEILSTGNFNWSGDDGDPVNTYTGEYFFSGTRDIYLGGPMPLFFSRYYASGIKQSGVTGSLGGGWTMIKVAKPDQDMRFDVPTIGPETIANLKKNGAKMLVIEAGKTVIIDREKTISDAEKAGIVIQSNKIE